MNQRINVAVDGPSGAGKSSVCKKVAASLNFTYIDTGAMYRAIAYMALNQNIDLNDEESIVLYLQSLDLTFNEVGHICANNKDIEANIRSEQVSTGASIVAKYLKVRTWCVEKQRLMAQSGGCIMDGRDIGSVVLPNAQCKIYLDASAQVRAQRRYQQNVEKGIECSFEEVYQDIQNRDFQDMNRTNSPLIRLDEAIYLDSSNLTFDQTILEMIQIIENVQERSVA